MPRQIHPSRLDQLLVHLLDRLLALEQHRSLEVEPVGHSFLPEPHMVAELRLLQRHHVVLALGAHAGIRNHPCRLVPLEVLQVYALVLALLQHLLLRHRGYSEMGLLEYLGVARLDQLLRLFHLLPLVRTQGFEVDLLQHLLLGLADIVAHFQGVNFGGFTLEGVSEVVSKELFLEGFLGYPLVKSLHVFESDPPLLIVVMEYLEVEGYLDFFGTQSASHFCVGHFLELLVVLYDVEVSPTSLGLLHLLLLQLLKLQISNPPQLEIVLDVGFLSVMHHRQIDQVGQLSPTQESFLGNEMNEEHDLRDVSMILFLAACEKPVGIFQPLGNELTEAGLLPVGDLHGGMYLPQKILLPLGVGLLEQENEGGGQKCKVGLFMIGVNVLHHHKRDGELEESCVQDLTHLAVFLIEEGQDGVDLFDLPSPYAELVLVAVVGQVDAIDRVVGFSQLQHPHLPGVDHGAIVSLHLQRVPNNWEGFHEVVLGFAKLEAFQEIGFAEHFFLILQGKDRDLLITGLLAQLSAGEDCSKLVLDDFEVFGSDPLQGECLLMVFPCDCSDTESLGRIVLAQLADTHSFADDQQLIEEPFYARTDILDCKAARSFFEGVLKAQRLLGDDVNLVGFFVSEGIVFQESSSAVGDLGGFLYLAVVHGEQLDLLHPASEAVDHVVEAQGLHRLHFMLLPNLFVVDEVNRAQVFGDHHPLTLLYVGSALRLPGILLQPILAPCALYRVRNLKAPSHGLKFIEESLLACIFDEVKGGDLLVPGVVELSNIHRHLRRETALYSQAEHGDVSPLPSVQLFHLLSQLFLAVGGILPIGNEDDGDGGVLGDRGQPLLELLEGSEDVGHASSVLLEVLREDCVFLQFGDVAEGDEEVGGRGDALIPKFGHGCPVAAHAA